jgi:hypothetical protein
MAARSAAPVLRLKLTERDLQVLCDLVRYGPLRSEQLAERHAFRSKAAAQARLRKLEAGGLLEHYALDTYLPTPEGTRRTDLGLRPPGKPGEHLPHHMAVADLAAWLLNEERGSKFVTERELRAGIGLPTSMRGHWPDGKLVLASGKEHAIELELHGKPADKYDGILRWFAGALIFERFRWYVRDAAIGKTLDERAKRHDLSDFMSIEPVPSVVRVLSWTG